LQAQDACDESSKTADETAEAGGGKKKARSRGPFGDAGRENVAGVNLS